MSEPRIGVTFGVAGCASAGQSHRQIQMHPDNPARPPSIRSSPRKLPQSALISRFFHYLYPTYKNGYSSGLAGPPGDQRGLLGGPLPVSELCRHARTALGGRSNLFDWHSTDHKHCIVIFDDLSGARTLALSGLPEERHPGRPATIPERAGAGRGCGVARPDMQLPGAGAAKGRVGPGPWTARGQRILGLAGARSWPGFDGQGGGDTAGNRAACSVGPAAAACIARRAGR